MPPDTSSAASTDFEFEVGNSRVRIGAWSYGASLITVQQWGEGASLSVGRFCSIAPCTVLLGGNHRLDWTSTYPFGHVHGDAFACTPVPGHPATGGDVRIGNDVWIGQNVTILSGVTVGDGAVLAANATVTRDVPPYTVMAGNPARAVRTRFTSEVVELLLALRWWDLPQEAIRGLVADLCAPPQPERLRAHLRQWRGGEEPAAKAGEASPHPDADAVRRYRELTGAQVMRAWPQAGAGATAPGADGPRASAGERIEREFEALVRTPSDINEHLRFLRDLATGCEHVTEMGVRGAVSTWALLAARPKRYVGIDIAELDLGPVRDAALAAGIAFEFRRADTASPALQIEPTDLLMIDTWHVYEQLSRELQLHHGQVRRCIVMHDTTTFANHGEGYTYEQASVSSSLAPGGRRGLWPAISEFLAVLPEWELAHRFHHNNGLTVLRRRSITR